ncbi:MAG: restriction endonuclease subunit S [Phaeodactylibacter sp.]|uniref:restriction endonuclease subunit S n=1 Tax=Phaeodactylibacter sp. TaxID=1940289 RepID=UPI0032EF5F36
MNIKTEPTSHIQIDKRTQSKHKKTELGLIPDDWEVVPIGNKVDLLTGFPFPSSKFKSNGIKLLKGSNIKRGNIDWRPDITDYWESHSPQLSKYILKEGDVVVAMDGSLVGKSFAQISTHDLPSLLLQRVARLRSKSCDINYLKQLVCSPLFTSHCETVKTASAIPHISSQDIKDFLIPIPPTLAEQTAIATALSDMDALIEAQEALLVKKRLMKQGAMQELLTGKRRLVETDGTSWQQTEVGRIPGDWEVVEIENISIKVGSGITPKGGSKIYKDEGRVFIRSQNVGWGDLHLNDVAFIDELTHSAFNATELEKHDVLLNITGASIGRCAVATEEIAGGNVNQHVCIIRCQPSTNPYFLSAILLSDIGQRQIESFQSGGNRQGLNFGQLKSILLPLPPNQSEQSTIANALKDMDSEIEQLEAQLAKYRQLKRGMMQELLTGRKRLI